MFLLECFTVSCTHGVKAICMPVRELPEPGSQHIWRIRLTGGEASDLFLSEDEKQRAEGLRHPTTRRRFQCFRTALRTILASYGDGDPSMIQFCYGSSGKPSISRSYAPIEFSFAHTQEQAVCAISRSAIGVDIEVPQMQLPEKLLSLAARFFQPEEFLYLQSVSTPELPAIFFKYWTLKEALIKMNGWGIGALLQLPPVHKLASDTTGTQDWIRIPGARISFSWRPEQDCYIAFAETGFLQR